MDSYDESTYGERWAEVYDEWHKTYDEAAIETLTDLASGGAVLELGIGTGRLALPLVQRGLTVQGIDTSPAMIARLRAKPGGGKIPVTMGHMADLPIEGKFALIFVAFNTIFTLASQEEQVRCFRNVASHLTDGGAFAIEAFVPDLGRFDRGQTTRAIQITGEMASLELSKHDVAQQRVTSQMVVFSDRGMRMYPIRIRYAWPSELDLMAQLAGLRLRHRWSNWRRDPVTAASTAHISIYERLR